MKKSLKKRMQILITVSLVLMYQVGVEANQAGHPKGFIDPVNINFQAEVLLDGSPANGEFDVEFYLFESAFDVPMGGSVGFIGQNLIISDGLLVTELNFGEDVFKRGQLWLEVVIVDTNGSGQSYVLEPRTAINPVPIAMVAKSVLFESIDTDSIRSRSVTSAKIANQAVTNMKLEDRTIGFEKLGVNGANAGDVIQFDGDQWQADSFSASPWMAGNDSISYTDGNVGIGTSAPSSLLHIEGDQNDELRLYGMNSTPSIHFRRLNGAVDWVLKQSNGGTEFHIQTEVSAGNEVLSLTSSGRLGLNASDPEGVFDLRNAAGEMLFRVNTNGEIDRKSQTREMYLSYKSFVPASSPASYETVSLFGLSGLSASSGAGSLVFHSDVMLPIGAIITEVEVMVGDNVPAGEVSAQFGYRLFGNTNGIINLSTLTSSDSPFSEVLSDNLTATVAGNRSYFVDVTIDEASTNAGQALIFAGVKITYEVTDW